VTASRRCCETQVLKVNRRLPGKERQREKVDGKEGPGSVFGSKEGCVYVFLAENVRSGIFI
jgi:hypothetical protein